jgi:hypothetical protein
MSRYRADVGGRLWPLGFDVHRVREHGLAVLGGSGNFLSTGFRHKQVFECTERARRTHHFSGQIFLDPLAEVVASTNRLNYILAAAVSSGALQPHKRRRAVTLEVSSDVWRHAMRDVMYL